MALVTRYVNHAIVGGADDGTSEANAYGFLYDVMSEIKTDAGTNNFLVYVKSGESYGVDGTSPNPAESDDVGHDGAGGDAGAIIYIDQLAPGITTPNTFEGYTATPGDGGVATLDCAYDGANKLTNGIKHISAGNYWVIKNFDIINASGDGVEGTGNADFCTYKNVRVKACGGMGWNMDNNINWENCVSDGNSIGFDGDSNCTLVSCIARNNSSSGITLTLNGVAYNTLSYDNGDTDVIKFNGAGNALGCTVDGNEDGGKTASKGIRQDNANTVLNVVNCIVYDCATGILADGDAGDLVISRNNLFNGNSDDASNFQTEYNGGDGAPSTGNGVGDLGHVTGVPGFTGTYLPGSNAQNAALDHQYTNNFWASFDDSDNPPEPENE